MLMRNRKFLFIGIMIALCFIFAWAQDPEYKELSPYTGNLDATRSDTGINGQWLRLDTTNDPLTGDLEILKADPEIKLTDTGDGNNTRIIRSDSSAVAQRFNTVLQPGGALNALDFDGSDDWINLGDSKIINGNGAITLMGWFKTSSNNRQWIVAEGFTNFNSLEITVAGAVLFGVSADTNDVTVTSAAIYDDGNWHLAIGTYDGANVLLYVDGFVEVDTDTNTGNITTGNGKPAVGAARRSDDIIAAPFFGTLDEIAIWNIALSANDVSDLWNGGTGLEIDPIDTFPTDGGTMGDNLIGLWHHNESAMNTATGGADTEDDSGQGNHGTEEGTMTDNDFVVGKLSTVGSDQEVSIWKSQDGQNGNEKGVVTFGDGDGRTIIKGGDVPGTGIHIDLNSIEIARWDGSTKTLILDNGVTTSQQAIFRAAVSASENIFEAQDSLFNIGFAIEPDFDVVIGSGAADKDYSLTFDGETNDGVITWMEDEDYFLFDDDIVLDDGEGLSLQEDITFTGATTENQIKFPDNLPIALDVAEATNSYLRFSSTNDAERIELFSTGKLFVKSGKDDNITAAIDTNALALDLMAGTYISDAAVIIDNNYTDISGTWNSALDASADQSFHVIDINGKDYVTIEGLRLKGEAGGANAKDLIYGNGCWYGNYKNLNLVNSDLNGIYLVSSPGSNVSGCLVENADQDGIYPYASHYSTIFGNRTAGSDNYGLRLNTTIGSCVFGNASYQDTNGIYVFATPFGGNAIMGNVVYAPTGTYGIYGRGLYTSWLGNIVYQAPYSFVTDKDFQSLIGNIFYDSSVTGAHASANADWLLFLGNMWDEGANTKDDLYLAGTNNYVNTSFNMFKSGVGKSERGVNNISGNYGIYAFNMFDGHDTAGIELGAGTSNNIVFGNMLEGEAVARIIDNGSNNIVWDFDTGNMNVDVNSSITFDTDIKAYFRDTAIGIYSQADTFLDLFADGAVRIGDSAAGAPTTYVEIEPDADVTFVGAGTGLAFGETYAHAVADVITSINQNDWDQIVAFDTDGESNNTTPDHTNDHITITKPGIYLVNLSWSGYGPAVAHDWDIHICKNNNGTCFDNITAHFTNLTTQKTMSVSASGLASLAVNDTIEMWVKRTSAGNNIDLTTVHCSISLTQIGGN